MKESRLEALGAHIAAQQDQLLERAAGSETTRRKLAEQVALRVGRSPERAWSMSYWRLWSPVVALGVVALVLFGARNVLFPALQFRVGAELRPGVLRDWVNASPTAALPIRFSDGTRVDLAPDARARVLAVGRAGAEVVLESGRARFDVEKARRLPGEDAWKIDVGPFVVEVKGTTFDVGWNPRTDQFALDLLEGAVTVRGCGREAPVDVVAGQGIRASCKHSRWTFAPLAELAAWDEQASSLAGAPSGAEPAPEPAPTRVTDEQPAVAPAASTNTTAVSSNPALSVNAARSANTARDERTRATESDIAAVAAPAVAAPEWRELARAGHYGPAYELATNAGFATECERWGAEDVLLLGNVARLSGHTERAAQAYGAVRHRFGGTASAARAAFALGRLRVESDRGAAERWFEVSLREEPRGPFAQAAADWLFELAVRSGDAERQRARARTYLDNHPNGSHAQDARRVLEPAKAQR